jgi:hypothetical protein
MLERHWRNLYVKGKTPEEAATQVNTERSNARLRSNRMTLPPARACRIKASEQEHYPPLHK